MFRLGITGSIGSGKTTVSRRFEELGARLSISDDLAKEILFTDTEIQAALLKKFGDEILNTAGIIDRQKLAATAFRDPQNQQFLNSLVHPRVRQQTLERMNDAVEDGIELFVLDVPLLYEAGVEEILDAVLVVKARVDLRLERVLARGGITAEDFTHRDSLQMPQEEKAERADYVIENEKSLDDLIAKADRVYQQIMSS